jgi:hypothetical protein
MSSTSARRTSLLSPRIRVSRDAISSERLASRLARDKEPSLPLTFPAESLMNLEAPPGFEPGMEVLQTSALPLGDGAARTNCMRAGESGRVYSQRRQRADGRVRNFICRAVRGMLPSTLRRVTPAHRVLIATLDILRTKAGSPSQARSRERRLERETGFEPATSTLARSHSTTELFPLATKP